MLTGLKVFQGDEKGFLAVAHGPQDHGQDLIPGHLPVGVEGGGSGALDVAGVLAVADITRDSAPVATIKQAPDYQTTEQVHECDVADAVDLLSPS